MLRLTSALALLALTFAGTLENDSLFRNSGTFNPYAASPSYRVSSRVVASYAPASRGSAYGPRRPVYQKPKSVIQPEVHSYNPPQQTRQYANQYQGQASPVMLPVADHYPAPGAVTYTARKESYGAPTTYYSRPQPQRIAVPRPAVSRPASRVATPVVYQAPVVAKIQTKVTHRQPKVEVISRTGSNLLFPTITRDFMVCGGKTSPQPDNKLLNYQACCGDQAFNWLYYTCVGYDLKKKAFPPAVLQHPDLTITGAHRDCEHHYWQVWNEDPGYSCCGNLLIDDQFFECKEIANQDRVVYKPDMTRKEAETNQLTVLPGDYGLPVCGNVPYDYHSVFCCGGYTRERNKHGQGPEQMCCGGETYAENTNGNMACCGTSVYDVTSQICTREGAHFVARPEATIEVNYRTNFNRREPHQTWA